MRHFLLTVLSVWTISIFAPVQEISAQEAKGPEDLFESKCSICHASQKAKSKKKTRDEWEATVMRMKNVNGAPVSDEAAQIIIAYLAKNYGK